MHFLDTDTLHAGHTRVVDRLRRLEDPVVGTTIVTKIELLPGRFDHFLKASTSAESLRAQERLFRTEELLAQMVIVPFSDAAAHHAERLRGARGLKRIGRADLLVASPCAPRNLGHPQRSSLPQSRTVVNWVDP